MTVDVYRLHHNLLLLRDDACDVVHDTEVVVSYNAQRYVILRCSLAAPSCFHYSIAETLTQFGGIRTVLAMYLDAAVHGHEAEYLVAVDRMAALCQRVVYAFKVAVDNQLVV